jgi:hypothetical protein
MSGRAATRVFTRIQSFRLPALGTGGAETTLRTVRERSAALGVQCDQQPVERQVERL